MDKISKLAERLKDKKNNGKAQRQKSRKRGLT